MKLPHRLRRFARSFLPILSLLGTPLAAQPAVHDVADTQDADPALWVVRDADTTIYLFGTVHVLRPGLSWFDEAVRAAFDSSDELETEIPLPVDPRVIGPQLAALAPAPDGRTITGDLTPEQLEVYRTGLTHFGIDPAQIDHIKPWVISLQLALALYAEAGYDSSSGAEQALAAAAEAGHKHLAAFETVEQQLDFLDSTPRSEQIAGILQMLGDLPAARAAIDTMIGAWARGDPDTTANVINEGMDASPETFRILLTDRNRRWAQAIKARLDQPGTVFVAVGTGHLAGPTSVQAQLHALGIEATRVKY